MNNNSLFTLNTKNITTACPFYSIGWVNVCSLYGDSDQISALFWSQICHRKHRVYAHLSCVWWEYQEYLCKINIYHTYNHLSEGVSKLFRFVCSLLFEFSFVISVIFVFISDNWDFQIRRGWLKLKLLFLIQ